MPSLRNIFRSIVIGTFAAPAMAATTGPVLNPGNGHTYYLFDDGLSFADAQALATGLGGYLAVVNDAAENAWILGNLVSASSTYWIGLRDDVNEGSFEWVNGDPLSYTNWAVGEPDDDVGTGGGGDFGYFNGATGTWGDTNGSFVGFVGGGIVEVTPSAVPVPAAAWFIAPAIGLLAPRVKRRRARDHAEA